MSETENCTHNCETCGEACSSRKQSPEDFREALNPYSSVKYVIGVVSGKGGVGKSLITALTAVSLHKKGFHTAILDADITGPSIPKIFGIRQKAEASEMGILPVRTKKGIDVISVNLLLENETDPVVWRGPVIAGTVKQFWTDVVWHDVDYMLIDMPPGTGDVPLTVFQSIPVNGIIIVTSPQELVSLIVSKAIKMANMMHIPVIGIVENMSYFKCPDCGRETKLFGESHIEEIVKEFHIPLLARIPIDPEITQACDRGEIESLDAEWVEDAVLAIQNLKPIE